VWVVANKEHRFLVQDIAHQVDVSCSLLLEPAARNTAAAMAAAALNAEPDQLLLFLPADHYIPDVEAFEQTIREGAAVAQQGAWVTFGVQPTSPSSAYGYIQAQGSGRVLSVSRFIEKPTAEKAMTYLASGNYYWNAGIFLLRADTLLNALQIHAPDILSTVKQAVKQQHGDAQCRYLDEAAFRQCRAESIDFAVLEHYSAINMLAFNGLWSDVGSWNAVAAITPADEQGNRIVGQGITQHTTSTYIHAPHRPVVALGTEDLFIVDTPDAVLVANKQYAQQVKDVVNELKEQQCIEATQHRQSKRPWGHFDNLEEDAYFKVKRLSVKVGGRLSLQSHQHRAEHWVVVKGTARVTKGEQTFLLYENESTFIPVNTKHRLENAGDDWLEIIEVQSGHYLGEDDIVRFSDCYGRSVKNTRNNNPS
jgi:mannose-1-phosphate guanylyltransferase/mannose-6-phosphate isomerase